MTTSTQIRSPIHGMTCSACATRIEKALRRIDGIETVAVNFATEYADIAFDSSKLASSDVADAITATGYSIDDTAFSFEIGGMTCSACASPSPSTSHNSCSAQDRGTVGSARCG